jgi:hypothetical protein
MSSSKLKNQFLRPLVVGAVSAVGAMAVGANYNVTLPLLGAAPKAVFYGLLGAGSSFATETVHQWVLPYLPQSDSAVRAENALLAPAIHAGINVAALQVFYSSMLKDIGFMEPILIGAGAEVVGAYGFDAFLLPQLAM